MTYDREHDLKRVVSHLNKNGLDPIIYDDGSTYETKLPNYHRHEHRGKKGFIHTWEDMLKVCRNNNADLYIFMGDDFHDLDLERLYKYHQQFKLYPYACNIINDGRTKCWTNLSCLDMGDYYRLGFVDGGFFCNREALDRINFSLGSLPNGWHNKKNRSSGVGMLLSTGFHSTRVKMYTLKKSLAFHGDHESKMHPKERKKNPLISK
jgi:hypothetical protein